MPLTAAPILLLAIQTAADPSCLPIKPPNTGGVYVIAHRGAHQGIPENTLAAYRSDLRVFAA